MLKANENLIMDSLQIFFDFIQTHKRYPPSIDKIGILT